MYINSSNNSSNSSISSISIIGSKHPLIFHDNTSILYGQSSMFSSVASVTCFVLSTRTETGVTTSVWRPWRVYVTQTPWTTISAVPSSFKGIWILAAWFAGRYSVLTKEPFSVLYFLRIYRVGLWSISFMCFNMTVRQRSFKTH